MTDYSEAIKWSKEVINTSPDSFTLNSYSDDCGSITIKQPGIYEIVFAFFLPTIIQTDKDYNELATQIRPSINLRLDGRPVLSTFDSSQ